MATIVEQLRAEIKAKQAELKSLEAALSVLTGAPKVAAKKAGKRSFTPEQKAAAAERMKAYHAKRKVEGSGGIDLLEAAVG